MMKNFIRLNSLLLLILGINISYGQKTATNSPNVIIIYADDLGFGDVGCYNSDSKIPTPNIDALAINGVKFTDAHAPSSICSPSRYGILTGAYSWRTKRKRGNPAPGEQPWIKEGRTTIASMLRDNGYNTAAIGKWGLGADWNNAAKSNREGLDISANAIDYGKPIYAGKPIGFTYEDVHLWYGLKYFSTHYACHDVPGTKEKADGGRWYFENGMSRDGDPKFETFNMEEAQMHYIQKTVEYIDVAGGSKQNQKFNLKQDAPFFIYYAPHIPHYPHVPAKQFQGKTKLGLYGDFIYELDWAVGQIVDALKRNNLLENTIIIFTSDNGPETQTYGYVEQFSHRSMGELRGVKRDLYEGGHHVPFIVSYPSQLEGGSTSNQLVSQTDILATLADYLDIELGNIYAEDSYSFLNEIIKESSDKEARTAAIHHSASGKLAFRSGDWVLIHNSTGDDNGIEPEWFKKELGVKSHISEFELFNMKEDPRQSKNLATKNPKKLEELRKELFNYIYEGRMVKR